ncbi:MULTISPECIES: hypothetical protein [unclassified Haladaptatus]|uniref:hypothetical protein n=2 Tax=Haladaptatus TaxID=367188 RepID=UPI0023E792DF|nr:MULTISPECIES: hypothetical protein [unclassified Haladaptatus]
MATTRRCPDCGVGMEQMELQTGDGFKLYLVTNEPKPGLLGGLGVKEKLGTVVAVCPECGLIRHYAKK